MPKQPLTDAERGRLTKLIQELSEVIQIATKTLEYGWIGEFEGVTYDNRHLLEMEMGDAEAVKRLMMRKGDVSLDKIQHRMIVKTQPIINSILHEHEDDDRIDPRFRP